MAQRQAQRDFPRALLARHLSYAQVN